MLTCTRRLQFCAGHRVMGHENKCAQPHGHNYVVHITARAALDTVGRVVDFGVLKDRMGDWIDDNWDHGFVVCAADAECIRALEYLRPHGLPPKVFELPTNPTAENMAAFLGGVVFPLVMPDDIECDQVVVQETENCSATWVNPARASA